MTCFRETHKVRPGAGHTQFPTRHSREPWPRPPLSVPVRLHAEPPSPRQRPGFPPRTSQLAAPRGQRISLECRVRAPTLSKAVHAQPTAWPCLSPRKRAPWGDGLPCLGSEKWSKFPFTNLVTNDHKSQTMSYVYFALPFADKYKNMVNICNKIIIEMPSQILFSFFQCAFHK